MTSREDNSTVSSKEFSLRDKVVVVSGGCGLLGREFARAIAGAGGTPVIADVDAATGAKTAESLKEETGNPNVLFVSLDITSKASVADSIAAVKEKFGRIDALVNSAYPRNRNYGREFFEVEYSDFCENVDMHLGGYFLMCQQYASYFIWQGYGNILNVASVYGVIPPRFEIYRGTSMTMPVEYAAIKSSLIHLTRYIAKYLKGRNIRVNAISPGGIIDGQPESFLHRYGSYSLSKGMLDQSDLSGTVVFLLSDSSQYINGQNIIVDDGFSL